MTGWLVTGATGLLGANAAVHLSRHSDVVCSSRSAPEASPLPFLAANLADRRSREGLVEKAGAGVVLHSAAIASLEACEADPALAQAVNVDAAGDLARQAAQAGAKFVHISTDAVFDGEQGNYDEKDTPRPQSEYGRTKLRAEHAVLEQHEKALVARVNFYGWSPSGRRSLAEFFYRNLREGRQVPGFTDSWVSTLQVGHLVEALTALANSGASGVLHVVSSEPVSKYDFGRRLAETFGFDPDLVFPASSADHLGVRRGSQLHLSTRRVEALLERKMPGQGEGLERLHAELQEGMPERLRSFDSTKGDPR